MRAHIIALAALLPSLTLAQTPASNTATPTDTADDSASGSAFFVVPSFDTNDQNNGPRLRPAVSKLYADLRSQANQPSYRGVLNWLRTQRALPDRRIANQLAAYQYALVEVDVASTGAPSASTPALPAFITAMPQSLQGPASSLIMGEAAIVKSDIPAVESIASNAVQSIVVVAGGNGSDFNSTDILNGTDTDTDTQSGMSMTSGMSMSGTGTASTTSGQGVASSTSGSGGPSTATGSSGQSGSSTSVSQAGAERAAPGWIVQVIAEASMGRLGGAFAVGALGLGLAFVL